MSSADKPAKKTTKQTIEFDTEFLNQWNEFCTTKGLSKRQASHAAILAFMDLNAEGRENVMSSALTYVSKSRKLDKQKTTESTSSDTSSA
jgi:hypothetical protein